MANSWDILIARGDLEPTEKEQKEASAKYKRELRARKSPNATQIEWTYRDKWAYSLYQHNAKKRRKPEVATKKSKPWDVLKDRGDPEPTEEEQRKIRAKYTRAIRTRKPGNSKKIQLSLWEQWGHSLYHSNANKNTGLQIDEKKSKPSDHHKIGDVVDDLAMETSDGDSISSDVLDVLLRMNDDLKDHEFLGPEEDPNGELEQGINYATNLVFEVAPLPLPNNLNDFNAMTVVQFPEEYKPNKRVRGNHDNANVNGEDQKPAAKKNKKGTN